MSYSCPMTFEKVDSNISRLNSLFVSILVITYLITSNIFLLYFLVFDFSIRLFVQKKASPLYLTSQLITVSLKFAEKLTDAGAKRLAAYFGLLFVLLLLLTHLLNLWYLSLGVAVIFLSCSLLDVIFNYCLGCKIYFIVKKIYPKFML
ncbi:DUF4395 domain-containing protein [bacterium]|nr:DUF4395 domain-containing protein [bacterium]MBU1990528.1 DUF4395 domain-containing protein [bacterium]